MTPEQDFERHLADWLEDGPNLAPAQVVDHALARTAHRKQRRGLWRWLVLPIERIGHRFPTQRATRLATLATVLAGVLLTSAVISLPFGGGPGSPPPVMDDEAIVAIEGTSDVEITSETPTQMTRAVEIETGDQRIDGQAVQELDLLLDSNEGLSIARGNMRLDNDWGTWEGPVDIIRYPSGEENEYAALEGTGTYEGFTYHYAIHGQPPGTVRTFEGAIWPDEPPAMPDPSSLP